MRPSRFLAGAAVVAATLAASSACSSTSAASNDASGSTVGKSGLAAAARSLSKLQAVPDFKAPGPAVDVSKLKGKNVFVIPISDTPFGAQVEVAEKKVAKATGVNLTYYSNQGAVSDWVKGMQTAVARHVDLIELFGAPDPRQLQPQIAAAKAAGIPVIVAHFYDASMPGPPDCAGCAAGVSAVVKVPFSTAAAAMSDWTIVDSKGTADVLIVSINGLLPAPSMLTAEKDEYAKYCPGCKVKVVSIDASQLGNGGPLSAVQSALVQDPKIDYVNPLFDAMIPGSLAAVQSANMANKVKMMSYNGSAFAMKDVSTSSSQVKMDVAESGDWIGYADMDQAFRVLSGMPAADETTPLRVFDSANIAQAGPSYVGGFGDSYESGFRALWGLS